jgi:hypothetical protein
VQTRAAAWGARSLVHALLATPDADTDLRDEFIDLAELLIDHHHAVYVAQPNNQFGWVDPGEYYSLDGAQGGSAWQQDFYTAAYGYMNTVELPISSTHATKLDAFFHWKARSIVFRLGLAANYWWVNSSAAYIVAFSPSFTPDYQDGAGPWYASDKALYDATFASPPAWMSSTEGVLGEEYTSDVWARSLIGNMHPAIAYAVRHDVAGASDAYARLTGATNYSAITTGFAAAPVWSVEPFIPESVPMTMRKTIRCDTVSLIPGTVVCGDRGHGVLAAGIASGFPIASLLEDEVDAGDPVGTEYTVRILTIPVGLDIRVDEDGSYVATGADGTYVGDKETLKSGMPDPATTYTVNIGFTSVSSDLAASYAMSGQVSSSLAASYGVLASISSSLAASYSMLASVSGDLAGSYLIDSVSSQISSDLAASYAVYARINSELPASYAIVSAINASLACSYAIDAETNYVRAPSGGGYRTKRKTITGRNTAQDGNR